MNKEDLLLEFKELFTKYLLNEPGVLHIVNEPDEIIEWVMKKMKDEYAEGLKDGLKDDN